MSRTIRPKPTRFSSLLSLTAITALLLVFSLVIPEFLLIPAGRMFVIVWALAAILVFFAHAKSLSEYQVSSQRQTALIKAYSKRENKEEQHKTKTGRLMRG